MKDITLEDLLAAGCHFGHKSERWHPKAKDYIYTEKDGIHIIDLAQTKDRLTRAAEFVRGLAADGQVVLFVGTKRQARSAVESAAQSCGASYLTERWIGGFLTNWESVKKNIDKIKRLAEEQETGAWKKFPKHEQSKLARYLNRLKVFYGGVLSLTDLPAALFIVDIKKEIAALREAVRCGIPVIALVDTNVDPGDVTWMIPANDDAVGSVEYISNVIAQSYREGKEEAEKAGNPSDGGKSNEKKVDTKEIKSKSKKKKADATETKETLEVAETKPAKKRGRPKKTVSADLPK